MHKWLLLIILLIALSVRTVFLDQHINAAYGDEVSIAYNAYSILKTGRDEFKQFMPLQFRSWGDQKNPVYIYTVSLFQIPLGMNLFSVRLPSALSGVLAVLLTYLITKLLLTITTDSTQKIREYISLFASLLLSLNPWHLHVSRGGYEANMALTCGLAAIYFILKWLNKYQSNHLKLLSKEIIISLGLATLGMYTYYTSKMFIPLFLVIFWCWLIFLNLTKNTAINSKAMTINAVIYIFLLVVLSLPFIYLALFSSGQARFSSINIFANPEISARVIEERGHWTGPVWLEQIVINKPVMWSRDFAHYFFDNLGSLYWYIFGDNTLRYTIGNHGVFYTVEAPFYFLGILWMFSKNKKLFLLLISWLVIAVLPTALVGKSYSLRSIAMLPVPMIFVSYGLVHSLQFAKNYLENCKFKIIDTLSKILLPVSVLSIVFLFTVSALNFLARYAYAYPTYGYYWYDGNIKDALDYAKQRENEVDKIVVTTVPGKTEMYYAFYANIDPSQYQQASLNPIQFSGAEVVKIGKYYFGNINPEQLPSDDTKTLVIAPPETVGGENLRAKDDQRILFNAKVFE